LKDLNVIEKQIENYCYKMGKEINENNLYDVCGQFKGKEIICV